MVSRIRLREGWTRASSLSLSLGRPAPLHAPVLVGSLVACAVSSELVSVSGRVDNWTARVGVLVVVAAFATGIGLGASVAVAPLRWIDSSVQSRAPISALLGLAASMALAILIIQPGVHAGAPAYWAATAIWATAVWTTGWLVLRLQPRGAAVALAIVVCSTSAGFDLAMSQTMYAEFHTASHWLTATSLSCAVARLDWIRQRAGWRRLAMGALIILPMGYGAATLIPDVHRMGTFEGRWFNSFHTALTMFADADGDGFSPWLWGGDCDDDDPTIFPGAEDPPGDGVDRNCNGVVDVADLPAHRGLRESVGSPCYDAGVRVDRVLLIVLDTFRPEALHPLVMPSTYRYFESGTLFTRTYANATSTSLSLPYLTRPDLVLPDVRDTLRDAGITSQREDEIPALIERLRTSASSPIFTFTHRLEMHGPYVMWPDTPELPAVPPIPPAYLSEANHLDRMLAPLWQWLGDPAIADRSLVILTADHGEAAGEHGIFGHTRATWEEITRVPLALRGPELPVRRIETLTSTRGVPATILGAFGLCDAAAEAERFVRSALRARAGPAYDGVEFALIETSRTASGKVQRGPEVVMVTRDGVKLARGLHDGLLRMYDLFADPEEQRDVAMARPETVPALVQALARAQDLGGVRPQPSRSNYLRLTGQ